MMARNKEFRITDDERDILELALKHNVTVEVTNYHTVYEMAKKKWLERRYDQVRHYGVYEITPAGRAVARQLGIGEKGGGA